MKVVFVTLNFQDISSFKHIFINFNMFLRLTPKFLIDLQLLSNIKPFTLINLVSLSPKLAIYHPKYIHLITPVIYAISQLHKEFTAVFRMHSWQPGPVASPQPKAFLNGFFTDWSTDSTIQHRILSCGYAMSLCLGKHHI